ncbi:hypothetical protein AAY473_006490 [Plecturocebus cupreus]
MVLFFVEVGSHYVAWTGHELLVASIDPCTSASQSAGIYRREPLHPAEKEKILKGAWDGGVAHFFSAPTLIRLGEHTEVQAVGLHPHESV